jgi:hypothetical protein
MTKEQIEAKIKEFETSRAQLVQNVSAHDGYIQCLKDMLKQHEESQTPTKLKAAK